MINLTTLLPLAKPIIEHLLKKLDKTNKSKLESLLKILWELWELEDILKQAKPWTWIILQVSWWRKIEVIKLTDEEKENFTKLVNNFKEDFQKWHKDNHSFFMTFWEKARDWVYKVNNFFHIIIKSTQNKIL